MLMMKKKKKKKTTTTTKQKNCVFVADKRVECLKNHTDQLSSCIIIIMALCAFKIHIKHTKKRDALCIHTLHLYTQSSTNRARLHAYET